jgi:hypothetical protein
MDQFENFKKRVSEAFSNYCGTEGCSCCEDDDHGHYYDKMIELVGEFKEEDEGEVDDG